MSWLHCDNCDALIDTGEDPDAYIPVWDKWLCEACRPVHPDPDAAYDETSG